MLHAQQPCQDSWEVYHVPWKKFVDAMVLMSDNHRTKDEELGFGGMLHMKSVKMRKSLRKCLLDNYDPTEDRVKFGTGESFTITPL